MDSIIQYLLIQNQYLVQIISFLFKFICKYIPLRQWIFDDFNSPEYQKFKVDEPPLIEKPIEVWYYKDFLAYIKWKYDVVIKPVKRQSVCDIPDDYIWPHCNAQREYLYKNNGSHNQILCKICGGSSSCNEPRKSHYAVPIVPMPLQSRKTASFSGYTNVLIPNVHTVW